MAAFLEYIPLIVFFIFFKLFDVFVATGALIVASVLHLLVLKLQKKPIEKRQWIFLGLIVVFGSMTIIFHDDLFLKWKVTIINGIFALALLFSRYGLKKNLMEKFMGEQIKLPKSIWDKFNLAWASFFMLCAVLNLYIAYNFDQETWVNFKVFGLMAMTFVFAIVSILSIYKYLPQEESANVSTQESSDLNEQEQQK
ncbi:septation protein A [Thalassotalea aquiviva]|uniref:septation protein A n=1 Tax=Thalassotalea aquiviva TaxID=3242415 RepID=UPI003529F0D5